MNIADPNLHRRILRAPFLELFSLVFINNYVAGRQPKYRTVYFAAMEGSSVQPLQTVEKERIRRPTAPPQPLSRRIHFATRAI
jgi:hypothetical protein